MKDCDSNPRLPTKIDNPIQFLDLQKTIWLPWSRVILNVFDQLECKNHLGLVVKAHRQGPF